MEYAKTLSGPDQYGNNAPFGGQSGFAGLLDLDRKGLSVPGTGLLAIPAGAAFNGVTELGGMLGLWNAREARGSFLNATGMQRNPGFNSGPDKGVVKDKQGNPLTDNLGNRLNGPAASNGPTVQPGSQGQQQSAPPRAKPLARMMTPIVGKFGGVPIPPPLDETALSPTALLQSPLVGR